MRGISKIGVVLSQGVLNSFYPPPPWSTNWLGAGQLTVVGPKCWLTRMHAHEVTKPLEPLLFYRIGLVPTMSLIVSFLILSRLVLFTALRRHFISQVVILFSIFLFIDHVCDW